MTCGTGKLIVDPKSRSGLKWHEPCDAPSNSCSSVAWLWSTWLARQLKLSPLSPAFKITCAELSRSGSTSGSKPTVRITPCSKSPTNMTLQDSHVLRRMRSETLGDAGVWLVLKIAADGLITRDHSWEFQREERERASGILTTQSIPFLTSISTPLEDADGKILRQRLVDISVDTKSRST